MALAAIPLGCNPLALAAYVLEFSRSFYAARAEDDTIIAAAYPRGQIPRSLHEGDLDLLLVAIRGEDVPGANHG